MEATQKLLQGIANVLWPLIVIVVILYFRPAVTAIVETAKSRKFTLKIGGQELTMEEANQAQQKLITDLQTQVSDMQKRMDRSTPVEAPDEAGTAGTRTRNAATVLWVDDDPKNISYLLESLRELGVRVDLAKSTKEGAALFTSWHYDVVISDMRRQEGATFNDRAGLDLLKLVKTRNPGTPVFFFTSQHSVDACGEEALRLGAAAITSSPTKLIGLLNVEAQKAKA